MWGHDSGRPPLTRRILVGVVGAPHGVRGDVRVRSFTARPAAIADYGPLHAEGRAAPLVTRAMRPLKDDMVVVRFEGVTGRDAAAALTGTRLFVERSALPETEDEEFYHADLIGLLVDSEEGMPVGRVRAIVNHGAGDILEIAGAEGDTHLVAFTRAFVPVVDIRGGRVVVTAQALAVDEDQEDEGPSAENDPGPGRR